MLPRPHIAASEPAEAPLMPQAVVRVLRALVTSVDSSCVTSAGMRIAGHLGMGVVESTDAQYRSLTVGRIVHEAITKRLDDPIFNAQSHTPPLPRSIDGLDIVGSMDLSKTVPKEDYERVLVIAVLE